MTLLDMANVIEFGPSFMPILIGTVLGLVETPDRDRLLSRIRGLPRSDHGLNGHRPLDGESPDDARARAALNAREKARAVGRAPESYGTHVYVIQTEPSTDHWTIT